MLGMTACAKAYPKAVTHGATARGRKLLFRGVGKTGRLDHCVAPDWAVFGDGGRKRTPGH